MPVATLPMYDLPEVRPATDALWRGLAEALRAEGFAGVPETLTRSNDPLEALRDPELLVGQTCGYPLTHELAGRVRVVGAPVYDAEGCEGARYRSAIVVAAGSEVSGLSDLRGGRCAINERGSHSGMNALRGAVAQLAHGGAFFGEVIETGSHYASMRMVGRGAADVAAIDCVAYALFARERPGVVAAVRVLGWTEPGPTLPFVTAAARTDEEAAQIARALEAAVRDPELVSVRRTLLLADVEHAELGDYEAILEVERAAVDAGYPTLR